MPISPEGNLEQYFVTEYWLIDQYIGDELLIWGQNDSGQLGDNTTTNRSTPVTTFAGGTNWKQVSCGTFHSAAIKTDGTLWVWGSNSIGRLGTNDAITRSTPVTTFAGGTDWKQIFCSSNNNAAIKTDGTLWTWGFNSTGQLGDNTTTTRSVPVTTFAGGTNWKQVVCGSGFVCAIKTDGTLWTWGTNTNGNLGVNDTTQRNTPVTTFSGGTNWKQVAGGSTHTAAIKTDGTLWVWGSNSSGQLGDNTITTRSIPVTTFTGGTNWKQVACGNVYTTAIKTDGTLWVWGYNTFGRLGTNDTIDKSTPVTTFAGGTNWKQIAVGNTHTAAIKTDGTLWVWGSNSSGNLGVNDTTQRNTPVTTFAGGTNWKQVGNTGQSGNHIAAVLAGTTPDLPIS